ncbi:RHS repeat-associated core domain-containing protein [Flavobacteriaceae bacterium 3-367]
MNRPAGALADAGNYIYEGSALQFFNHAEGYIEPDGSGGYDYIFQYKDHLGNIRLAYHNSGTPSSPTLQIREENNYYPFGLKHKGYNGGQVGRDHKFEFQGVEFEESLDVNLHEMDFRQYDPALGRFMSIDPLGEERMWVSPYNFVQNNPILRIDPVGLLDDYALDTTTGSLVLLRETGEDTDTIFTGTWVQNDDGEAEFEEDGGRKSFSTEASNIREVSGEVVDGIAENDIQSTGLVFNEGFEQEGLEVMEFISFNSEIELAGWGFDTDEIEGIGLAISPWLGNDSSSSSDVVGDSSKDVVTDAFSGKVLGNKVGSIHTHPGDSYNTGLGFGRASGSDINLRNKGVNKKYPHFINSKYDGWTEY